MSSIKFNTYFCIIAFSFYFTVCFTAATSCQLFAYSRTIVPVPPLYPCGYCTNSYLEQHTFMRRFPLFNYRSIKTASLLPVFASAAVVGLPPCPPLNSDWVPSENGPELLVYTTGGL